MHVVPQRVRPRTLPFLRFMRELGLSSMIHEVLHRLAICGITLLTGDVQSITLHGKRGQCATSTAWPHLMWPAPCAHAQHACQMQGNHVWEGSHMHRGHAHCRTCSCRRLAQRQREHGLTRRKASHIRHLCARQRRVQVASVQQVEGWQSGRRL